MQFNGMVEKDVTVSDILSASDLTGCGLSTSLVQDALSFLEKVGLAKSLVSDSGTTYQVRFEPAPQKSRSELDFFADKEARSRMRENKRMTGRTRVRRRRKEATGQMGLYDNL